MDDLGPILFAHAAQAWANIGHALGNALGDDNIGPGSDRVRKQYWAKFGATRVLSAIKFVNDFLSLLQLQVANER